jgi:hypothetical protein
MFTKRSLSVTIGSLLLVGVLLLNIASAGSSRSVDFERGSSQYLSVSDNSALDIPPSSDITLEAWVKLESQSQYPMVIAGKYSPTGNQRGYQLRMANDPGPWSLEFVISDDGTSPEIYSVAQSFSNATWYHVAVAWKAASSTAEFYVNGVSIGTDSGSKTTIFNNTAAFVIGALGDFNDRFDGLIDDVRVWNLRRTSAEIYNYYQQELNGNEVTLQGYWKLNNDLLDATAFGNNLTNTGAAPFSVDIPSTLESSESKVRKSSTQATTTTTIVYPDADLSVNVVTDKTYVIDGVVLVEASSTVPEVKFRLSAPAGSELSFSYVAAGGYFSYAEILENNETSAPLDLQADTPLAIHFNGTLKTGSTAGTIQLEWAQANSDSSRTSVLRGSYIRVDPL